MHACGDGCNHGGEDLEEENWSSFLHTLVHPGCTGHGGSCDHNSGLDELPRDGSGENLQAKRRNLNVDSALLHVLSDVFRGFLVFVLAIMIRFDAVGAKRADAICALLVVGLVLQRRKSNRLFSGMKPRCRMACVMICPTTTRKIKAQPPFALYPASRVGGIRVLMKYAVRVQLHNRD